nr:hypothetical protein [Alphaproteobacteria bacterium]
MISKLFVKNLLFLLIITGINITTFGWIPDAQSQDLPPLLPPQAVTSYVLVDLETGQILDGLNIDEIQPI